MRRSCSAARRRQVSSAGKIAWRLVVVVVAVVVLVVVVVLGIVAVFVVVSVAVCEVVGRMGIF